MAGGSGGGGEGGVISSFVTTWSKFQSHYTALQAGVSFCGLGSIKVGHYLEIRLWNLSCLTALCCPYMPLVKNISLQAFKPDAWYEDNFYRYCKSFYPTLLTIPSIYHLNWFFILSTSKEWKAKSIWIESKLKDTI